jgi:hypothetical protein
MDRRVYRLAGSCAQRAFYAGEIEVAFNWMKGLAATTMQGPIAQAHFTEVFVAPEWNKAAIKAPSDQPYINDWACVSGCNYLEPVVTSISELTPDYSVNLLPVRILVH